MKRRVCENRAAERPRKMAAHPLTTSRVRGFVEALAEWAEAPWTTTVNVPFYHRGLHRLVHNLRFTVSDGLAGWGPPVDDGPHCRADIAMGRSQTGDCTTMGRGPKGR